MAWRFFHPEEKDGVSRMKRFFGILLAVVMLSGVAQGAFALSDAEYKAMIAESREFREADEGLNGAWREARKMLPEDEMKKLTAEQREWVRKGRAEEAKYLIEFGTPKAEAYARVTMSRIEYINTVISRSVLRRSDKGFQGLYSYTEGGAEGILEVWWYDESDPEHFVVFENSVLRPGGSVNFCSFSGSGILKGNRLVAVSDFDESAEVVIVFEGGKAIVETDDDFKQSGFCGFGVYLDGVYTRQ